jgi:hypothetical protein
VEFLKCSLTCFSSIALNFDSSSTNLLFSIFLGPFCLSFEFFVQGDLEPPNQKLLRLNLLPGLIVVPHKVFDLTQP